MIPDMTTDWRFRQSPAVQKGNTRAYAGAQLRFQSDNGDDVAFGSLCVTSSSPQPPLSPPQQALLVRFADMISAEIVNRSREGRKSQRHYMAELVATVQVQAKPDNVEHLLSDAIKLVYPYADIAIQESLEDHIFVRGRSTPIPLNQLRDGLWEDMEYIDQVLVTQNHRKLHANLPVRAIVHTCLSQPLRRYLVVSSSDIQFVFDDVDSWFIERCARVLCNTIQEARLRDALEAKDRFLRGITHQLRTPIHGVLGSVDLLAEELASHNLLRNASSDEPTSNQLTTSSFLQTIRDSGRELMSTVNNMLKLNRWADNNGPVQPATLQSLNQVEADILHDVAQTIPEREMSQISLMFENQMATDYSMIAIDLVLLRECIQALILNALQFTEKGAVIITISGASDYSRLRFDVIDTGCGIKLEDRKRIFEPYEKVDHHTRGVGLGLTLAPRIAHAINGEVTLVSSEVGVGSHFRAEFHDPGFACPIDRNLHQVTKLEAMPTSFHIIPAEDERPDLVMHFVSP